jgi:flagellar protein FliT
METSDSVSKETANGRKWTSLVEIVAEFIKKSKQLLLHLEGELPSDERDEYIDSIHQLLDERSQLLNQLPDLQDFRPEIKEELLKIETNIQSLLANRQKVIKKDLQLLQIQKKKTNKYADPYGSISADGMFLDKKK